MREYFLLGLLNANFIFAPRTLTMKSDESRLESRHHSYDDLSEVDPLTSEIGVDGSMMVTKKRNDKNNKDLQAVARKAEERVAHCYCTMCVFHERRWLRRLK